jgi:TolB protein
MRKLTVRTGFGILILCILLYFLEYVVFAFARMAEFGSLGGWDPFFQVLEIAMALTLAAGITAPLCAAIDRRQESRNVGWRAFLTVLAVVAAAEIVAGPFWIHKRWATDLGSNYRSGYPFDETTPCFSPDGDGIVFCSLRGRRGHIWIMNTDGTDLKQLTDGPFWDVAPRFSPDGSKILFRSDRDIRDLLGTLHLMNADGSAVRCITVQGRAVSSAIFSPDGRNIVLTAGHSAIPDIYSMDCDTGGFTQLTKSGYFENWLCMSPDGRKIAFSRPVHRRPSSDMEIFTMDADGCNQTRLTDNQFFDRSVAFSPDGEKILYLQVKGRSSCETWIMNTDGTDQRLLVDEGPAEFFLRDGRFILTSDKAVPDEYELYSLSADGSNRRQLTHLHGYISQPSCTTDGKRIVFLFERKGRPGRGKGDIYTLTSDGSDLKKIGTNY